MENEIDLKKEVLELVQTGCYDIVQQINDSPEEPYEGCIHNLYMILDDDEPIATLLGSSDPQTREGCKTYKVEFDTFMGHCTLIIWEI